MSLFVYIIIYIPFVCLSLPGQLGTNPFVSAPPAVPHSTSLLRGAAGGLSADTPFEVTLTESPGKVLPMTQEDVPPPPPFSYLCVHVHVFRVLFYLRFTLLFTGCQIQICFTAL